MQIIERINKNKILKTTIIILSIPVLVKIMYYINILGIYLGTFLRKLIYLIG